MDVDDIVVRSLLRAQHPDLADLEMRAVPGGWDTKCGELAASWRCSCRYRCAPVRNGAELSDARSLWQQAVAAPAWSGAPVWLHGDLHPANVVVADGTLAGALGFGDVCAGDPATEACGTRPAGSGAPGGSPGRGAVRAGALGHTGGAMTRLGGSDGGSLRTR
ncbi:phosphotransferase [Streptomyces puniciscabiei]|uniref:phosphotransferase n=1 Tax=Streptomyces puniciscabiei TaxID=164348 RepID=UPI0037AEAF3C